MSSEYSDPPEFHAQRLEGKVAIVTGAGSSGPGIGNGRAMSMLFAQHGCRVVVADISQAAADDTVSRIKELGGEAVAVTADVTESLACERIVTEALNQYGRLDILVNNVGITGPSTTVVDISERDWDHVMSVNVKSMLLMCKHAIPRMISGGSVVNIASIGAIRVTERPAYAASKGAVVSLTISMAGQHGGQHIRINAVLPGMVWTPMAAADARTAEEARLIRESRRKATLLQREGTSWDVAYACLYLASDESRWVTGQALVIDGGVSITRPMGVTSAEMKRISGVTGPR